MKHLIHRSVLLAVALTLLSACSWVSDLIHDDEVVARLGKHKLYRSELAGFIPHDATPEDSVRLAGQYINTWAKELLFLDVAGTQLSKTESDVTKELEDYRRSLLRYRYEQQYISERLDTVVSPAEIEEFYNTHQDLFALQVPIVKARFLDIMKESPALDQIKKKMASAPIWGGGLKSLLCVIGVTELWFRHMHGEHQSRPGDHHHWRWQQPDC